ncbi:hypothetical protein UK23_33230 [Lentzea aerocolonigenes]|uniref:Outer membrane channel protein CpnT-like N-terminal domain-containing protein n=1 Tax=Lentzea aerocolonigenes TaxID=68170 RepID=A0A0F0GIV2_LENAE|nr:hypothetical protein [Lentzea aerocolonigenes]KJK43434.1 hypothetical protein UK23_33230 [Lentzea aerocolonigenes]
MAIPEPQDDIWQMAKEEGAGWPPDLEDDAFALRDAWVAAANELVAFRSEMSTGAAAAYTAWPDNNGFRFESEIGIFLDGGSGTGGKGGIVGLEEAMKLLAKDAGDYGQQLADAKNAIIIEVALNVALLAFWAANPFLGLALQFFKRQLAKTLARTVINMISGRAASLGASLAARPLTKLAVKLGAEMLTESIEEGGISIGADLLGTLRGQRDGVDFAKAGNAALTGAVGGGLSKAVTPITKHLNNKAATAFVTNAITSPAAGHIVNSVQQGDFAALFNPGAYVDAIADQGLAAGTMALSRVGAVDAGQALGTKLFSPAGSPELTSVVAAAPDGTGPPPGDPVAAKPSADATGYSGNGTASGNATTTTAPPAGSSSANVDVGTTGTTSDGGGTGTTSGGGPGGTTSGGGPTGTTSHGGGTGTTPDGGQPGRAATGPAPDGHNPAPTRSAPSPADGALDPAAPDAFDDSAQADDGQGQTESRHDDARQGEPGQNGAVAPQQESGNVTTAESGTTAHSDTSAEADSDVRQDDAAATTVAPVVLTTSTTGPAPAHTSAPSRRTAETEAHEDATSEPAVVEEQVAEPEATAEPTEQAEAEQEQSTSDTEAAPLTPMSQVLRHGSAAVQAGSQAQAEPTPPATPEQAPAPVHTSDNGQHAQPATDVTVDASREDADFEQRAEEAFVEALNKKTPQGRKLFDKFYRSDAHRRPKVGPYTVTDKNGRVVDLHPPLLHKNADGTHFIPNNTVTPGKPSKWFHFSWTDLGSAASAPVHVLNRWLADKQAGWGERMGDEFADEFRHWLEQKHPGEEIWRTYDVNGASRKFDAMYARIKDGEIVGWVIIEAKSVYGEMIPRRGRDGKRYKQGHPENIRTVLRDLKIDNRQGEIFMTKTAEDGTLFRPRLRRPLADFRAVAESIEAHLDATENGEAETLEFYEVKPGLDAADTPVGLNVRQYDLTIDRGIDRGIDRDGAAAVVPGSEFHGQGRATADPDAVLAKAREQILKIAADADVRAIRPLGNDRFEVTRHDGTTFEVTLKAGEVHGQDVAQFKDSEITLSARAADNVIGRGLAHEIAELASVSPRTEDHLTPTSQDTDTTLSPHDSGRVAELRNLDRTHDETSRLRIRRRALLRQEMRTLIEHLGLAAEQTGVEHRRAALPEDARAIVERRTNTGPAWRAAAVNISLVAMTALGMLDVTAAATPGLLNFPPGNAGREPWPIDPDSPVLNEAPESPPRPPEEQVADAVVEDGVWTWKNLTLSKQFNDLVDVYVTKFRVAAHREGGIRQHLEALEQRVPGARLLGLRHEFKGPDRLKEKVAEKIEYDNLEHAEAVIREVPDAIRYTFCLRNNDYTAGVRAMMDDLVSAGFTPVKILNFWDKDQRAYLGVNTRWRDPHSGLVFEVQFHTPETWLVKNVTHDAYENRQDPRLTPQQRQAWDDYEWRYFGLAHIPDDVREIGND